MKILNSSNLGENFFVKRLGFKRSKWQEKAMEMWQTTVLCFKGNFQYLPESAFVMWRISKLPGGLSTLILLSSEKSVSFLSWICRQENLTKVITKTPFVPDGLTAVILSVFWISLASYLKLCSLVSVLSPPSLHFFWQRRPTPANSLKLSGKVFRVLLVAKLSRHLTFVSYGESLHDSWFSFLSQPPLLASFLWPSCVLYVP